MSPTGKPAEISPAFLAVLLAILAFGLFAASAALFYCGVRPFGSSAPPPDICFLAGGVVALMGCGSAYGWYHFSKQAVGPVALQSIVAAAPPPPVAMTAAASSNGHGPAPIAPDPPEPPSGLAGALLREPELQNRMGTLVGTLVQSAPANYTVIHLVVEARKAAGKISILFTHGSPAVVNQYSTLVPDRVSDAAFGIIDYLLRQDENAPGFEAVLRKTGSQSWDSDLHRLDEPGPQWTDLPRYPVRVCGHGLSLAPLPDTIFRWSIDANPPGIVAASSKAAEGPFRQAQLILGDAGPRVALGYGVAKAEEVLELSEGPAAGRWMIETPGFHALWPEGLQLRSPLASKTRFDLLGPDDAIVSVQGPVSGERPLDGMAADGQAEVARGKTGSGNDWIELAYDFGGARWRQRHYARGLSASQRFVITAQCLESAAEKIFAAAEEVTDSLSAPVECISIKHA